MPPRSIPVDAFADQLLARHTAVDDYSVVVEAGEHGRLPVGRIMRMARSSGRSPWFWTITGPAAPDASVTLAGEEADLDAAKAAIHANFNRLLHWAAEHKGGLLPWLATDQGSSAAEAAHKFQDAVARRRSSN